MWHTCKSLLKKKKSKESIPQMGGSKRKIGSSSHMGKPSVEDQVYYHGRVTRLHSEDVLTNDGDFLVRDSISQPDQCVLTAKWKGKALHFQINSTNIGGKRLYHFEEEQFESIVDLLSFYQSHRKAITLTSGCQLRTSVPPTTIPYKKSEGKELEAAYARVFNPHAANIQNQSRPLSQKAMINQALRSCGRPASTSTTIRPVIPLLPPSLANRPLPMPIRTPAIEDQNDYCDMDYDAMDNMAILDASVVQLDKPRSLTQTSRSHSTQFLAATPTLHKFNSIPHLSAKPPPLPPRPSTPMKCDSAIALDSSDYDEPKPSMHNKEIDSDYDMVRTKLRNGNCNEDSDELTELTVRLRDSGISMSSRTDIIDTQMLTDVCKYIKSLSTEELGGIICHEDAKLLNFINNGQKTLGVDNGLRQILLPSGATLREKLMLRSRCMQLTVVLTILHRKEQSSEMIKQWTFLATSLLHSHGNFFGFVNVIQGLTSKVLMENPAWRDVDMHTRKEFESAKSAFKHLRSTGEAPTSGTCVFPLLHPLLELYTSNNTSFIDESSFSAEMVSFWRWLDMGRAWSQVSDEMSARASAKYGHIRPGPDCPLSLQSMQALLCENGPPINFEPALYTIKKLLSEGESP